MFKIVKKRRLNDEVDMITVEAPFIAKKAKPGQFIILRVDEEGERMPLTIESYDREKGTVTVVYQIVGKTTQLLSEMNEGDELLDFVGPLGVPSHLEGYKNACVIGGGLGNAIALPQAKALHDMGANVDLIAGFRTKDIIILEDEMREASTNLILATDDGSNGLKGFVTDMLKEQIEAGKKYDVVIAIGPMRMMQAVCNLTKEYGIKTIVSMNPIMLDGTGMCGACRVTVCGETKFACIDGPDFDGHEVDFEEAISRSSMFKEMERRSADEHKCKLTGEVRHG